MYFLSWWKESTKKPLQANILLSALRKESTKRNAQQCTAHQITGSKTSLSASFDAVRRLASDCGKITAFPHKFEHFSLFRKFSIPCWKPCWKLLKTHWNTTKTSLWRKYFLCFTLFFDPLISPGMGIIHLSFSVDISFHRLRRYHFSTPLFQTLKTYFFT